MQKQQPPSGQGIHPPLKRLAFCVWSPFKFCGDATDMVETLEGCWVTGTCVDDMCAAGGMDNEEVDLEDIAS